MTASPSRRRRHAQADADRGARIRVVFINQRAGRGAGSPPTSQTNGLVGFCVSVFACMSVCVSSAFSPRSADVLKKKIHCQTGGAPVGDETSAFPPLAVRLPAFSLRFRSSCLHLSSCLAFFQHRRQKISLFVDSKHFCLFKKKKKKKN
ncbi:hypothetical protein FQA47_000022 [Oryzias melastigma]|uniref:Uncharacterized protein n=1 Tax=Oryzias melastigma TaxID=30732 RepID=A0A834CQH6_ORYME|nr:hypothetical protein FQA47_000022 [Oryzias melastigma]